MFKRSRIEPCRPRIVRLALMALALLLMPLSASTLLAQSDTGNIAGTVTDATGAVIPGANVLATNTENGLTLNAVSSAGATSPSSPCRAVTTR